MCCSLSPDSPPYAVPNPEPMLARVVATEESDSEEGKMSEAAAYPQAEEKKTQTEEENKTKKKKSSKERSMSMFSDYIV